MPCEAVRSLAVQVDRRAGGALELLYTVEGDPGRVRLPASAPPRRVDGLWRHTCFEAFIAPENGSAYVELNFAPSGEWAAYAFEGYRTGMRALAGLAAPAITLTRAANAERWSVRAAADVECLGEAPARLALAAVIEDAEGRLAYWALRHPPGKPDFHHPDGFSATL